MESAFQSKIWNECVNSIYREKPSLLYITESASPSSLYSIIVAQEEKKEEEEEKNVKEDV